MNSERVAKKNRMLVAMRQVRKFLESHGHKTHRVRHGALIAMFAEVKGIEITGGLRPWLLGLWESRTDADVFRVNIDFYTSPQWTQARRWALKTYGKSCMKCGSGDRPTVDHIRPRSLFPSLELDRSNLQVLCLPCNSSKGNRESRDYREAA